MGDPVDFYDAIITAVQALKKGQTGTLGELAPKPHPWLYAETARVGLGIPFENRHKVIGIEDSSAGVVSIKLAGFSCVGISGGNINLCCLRSNSRHSLYSALWAKIQALCPLSFGVRSCTEYV